MKNLKTLITAFCLTLLLTANLKAQDDPNVGFYVDGVKVNELTCYTFEKLTVVLAYKSNYNLYDRIEITVYSSYKEAGGLWDGQSYMYITKANSADYVKGNYLVYNIFSKKDQSQANGYIGSGGGGPVDRDKLQHKQSGLFKAGDNLLIAMQGSQITGYTEKYYEGCQCIKKEPAYSATNLARLEIPLTNRTKNRSLDKSQPCDVPGTKVDFNNLDK